MIERVSRYYTGPLAQTPNKYTGIYEISVFREFPTTQLNNFVSYIWKDGDSLGQIANQYLNDPKYWWEIADINPDLSDVFNIAPGTVIRIPNG
jgi:nucleoid-associated protein YgaU